MPDATLERVPELIARILQDKIPRIETWAKDLLELFRDQREVHVACFCEESDLLSQWRGYAASGGGYAIGVAVDDPWPSGNIERGSRTILRRVVYEPDTQRQIVRSWIRGMFDSDLASRQARAEHMRRTLKDAEARREKEPPADAFLQKVYALAAASKRFVPRRQRRETAISQ